MVRRAQLQESLDTKGTPRFFKLSAAKRGSLSIIITVPLTLNSYGVTYSHPLGGGPS
jgi:hypothetical protein